MNDDNELPPGAAADGSVPFPVALTSFAATMGTEHPEGLGLPTFVVLTMTASGVSRSYAMSPDGAARIAIGLMEQCAHCQANEPESKRFMGWLKKFKRRLKGRR